MIAIPMKAAILSKWLNRWEKLCLLPASWGPTITLIAGPFTVPRRAFICPPPLAKARQEDRQPHNQQDEERFCCTDRPSSTAPLADGKCISRMYMYMKKKPPVQPLHVRSLSRCLLEPRAPKPQTTSRPRIVLCV